MGKAKGGEYVRTRTVGGLTSEDIDGGIIGGANAATVVSHSGIFTIEFNKPGKSLMKKAKRVKMRNRYEHLIDSLASERVLLVLFRLIASRRFAIRSLKRFRVILLASSR